MASVIVSIAPMISVPLDQVSRASTGPSSNQRTFPPADERATNSPHSASDKRAFGSAVVTTAIVVSRVASLSGDTQTSKRSEYKSNAKKRG